MQKLTLGLLFAGFLALMIVGIAWITKHKSPTSVSAVLVTKEGKVRLSAEEALKSQQLIPVLQGKSEIGRQNPENVMKTINEVQEINRVNRQNAK